MITPPGRSPRLAWFRASWSRIVAGTAFAVVAGVTGRISYMHIEALTLAMHQPRVVAQLMPFGVDGLIVVGSMALLDAAPGQENVGWLCVGPGAAASLFANVESGWPYGVLPAAWAGMASAGFILATFTLERWLKGLFAASGRGGWRGQANIGAGTGAPGGSEAKTCTHGVASTVAIAAVQAFLHARDCLGEPLSQRQLSASFGLSRARVAELVAPHLPDPPSPNGNGPAADHADAGGSQP